ncbi:helix-turn-helix domain-containing protein [Xiamenia xianingshaonis]|uniref:Helix-turn-helix domain-containing protein n=1 Tax=Xiamenia xianingshaonis TaxID=2682776 RepID=A0A9E6MP59_9ACTN|nr:helix-turn-helix transcriptional regulator [Xiamenia xianingshaonis]NHM15003.1 helix-turn-helix domain-containing protein [Xiamenia xianingshaonis]QTU83747.1 helix-turn-helix transcriptional regulator [Xiamenia xianingshaonis]
MRAYDESYLNDAMDTLGEALDYAVADCGQDPDEFFEWFVVSGMAASFGRGNPKFVAGMSGVELAREVQFRILGKRSDVTATQPLDRTPEYWAGWFLAYYQWYRGIPFDEMARYGLVPTMLLERSILHEADASKAVAFADRLMENATESPSRLAFLRKQRGLTQQQLAEAADVSLRMVQLYEQRQNDLSKAAAGVVVRLAHVIGCSAEELLES